MLKEIVFEPGWASEPSLALSTLTTKTFRKLLRVGAKATLKLSRVIGRFHLTVSVFIPGRTVVVMSS
jgi:hypothetical protein